MTADRLAVWLYGIRVAVVEEDHGRLRLWYTAEAFDHFPPGAPLLSLSLPLIEQRFTHGVVRPFLDGLLPEEDARRTAAERLNLRAGDTYGLVRALGRDCAGAIVIQPDDDPAPSAATTTTAEPLTQEELAEKIANLPNAPLGLDTRVRLSLAGAQEKLLLTRLPNGEWGLPIEGTPSTHILKPEIPAYPKTVENEAFCMRLAKSLGVPVADVETTTIEGRRVIVVERYDRIVHPDGPVERIHQEDFCQALGVQPGNKYQEAGGPSLRAVADILQTVAEAGSVETLLRATTINVVTGNGDAHGKNFSLLHDRSGSVRLAPLYDVVSTLFYGLDRLAMYVDNVQRIDRVTVDRLVEEAVGWGIDRETAREIVVDVLDRIPESAGAAFAETEDTPRELRVIIDDQLAGLYGQRTGGRPRRKLPRRSTLAERTAIRS